jgi:hypothetical protein
MDADRPRIALAVSALGGIVTAIAVYQPFYGLGITPAGVSLAAQQVSALPGLSQYSGQFTSEAAPLAGRSLVGVSAHQALHNISVALLIIAAVAILISLVGLASARPLLPADSGQLLVGIGIVGSVLTVFRMIVRPDPDPAFITLTLRVGSYMALAGCAAIAAGGLWPVRAAAPAEAPAAPDVWSELSGWTPS